jgi:hypothetical protein
MITTSICLSKEFTLIWRAHRRQIMKFAVRLLRLAMHHEPVRRGVGRTYNRIGGGFCIVTARFTAAEYDALHFVASTIRVSVSSLVYQLIRLWKKPSRRNRGNTHVTNYELNLCNWSAAAGVVTESLMFWEKITTKPPYSARLLL